MKANTAIEGLPGSGKLSSLSSVRDRQSVSAVPSRQSSRQNKRLNRAGDVLQIERPKLLENKIEPVVQMVAHRSRDADAARRTFGLKPCRHIHDVAVNVGHLESRRQR